MKRITYEFEYINQLYKSVKFHSIILIAIYITGRQIGRQTNKVTNRQRLKDTDKKTE